MNQRSIQLTSSLTSVTSAVKQTKNAVKAVFGEELRKNAY